MTAGELAWARYFYETEIFDRGLRHRLDERGIAIVHPLDRSVSDSHARTLARCMDLGSVPGKREAERLSFAQLEALVRKQGGQHGE